MCQLCQLSLMYILQLIPPLALTLPSSISASRKLLAISPQTKRRQSSAPLCQLKLSRSTEKLTYLELPTFPLTNSTPTLSLPSWKALFPPTTFPLLATFLETGAIYGLQPATYNFLPIRPHPEHMVASSYQVSAFFSEHFALGLCVFIRSYPNTILVLIHNYNTSEDVNKIIVKHYTTWLISTMEFHSDIRKNAQ